MKLIAVGIALLFTPSAAIAHIPTPAVVADVVSKASVSVNTAEMWAIDHLPQSVTFSSDISIRTLGQCLDVPTITWTNELIFGCTTVANALTNAETHSSGKAKLAIETIVYMVVEKVATTQAEAPDGGASVFRRNIARLRIVNDEAKRLGVSQVLQFSTMLLRSIPQSPS